MDLLLDYLRILKVGGYHIARSEKKLLGSEKELLWQTTHLSLKPYEVLKASKTQGRPGGRSSGGALAVKSVEDCLEKSLCYLSKQVKAASCNEDPSIRQVHSLELELTFMACKEAEQLSVTFKNPLESHSFHFMVLISHLYSSIIKYVPFSSSFSL